MNQPGEPWVLIAAKYGIPWRWSATAVVAVALVFAVIVFIFVPPLTDALVQSEELGWPLAETLEGLADRLNGERVLRAQATAGAAGVYVMLPSTLVLLSAVLLLFAPFIVRYLVTGTLAD